MHLYLITQETHSVGILWPVNKKCVVKYNFDIDVSSDHDFASEDFNFQNI